LQRQGTANTQRMSFILIYGTPAVYAQTVQVRKHFDGFLLAFQKHVYSRKLSLRFNSSFIILYIDMMVQGYYAKVVGPNI